MAKYNEIFNSSIDWTNVFVRTSNFPLDRSSIFGSYEDALEYAKGTGNDERGLGGTSYVGQIISVYENDIVRTYKIIGKDIYNDATKTVEIKERGLEELISKEDTNILLFETDFSAEKVKTNEKINIIGTPLAQLINPTNSLDITIDPNNVQEILKMLFELELYPKNVVFTEGTIEPSVEAPIITSNYEMDTVVEVGTEIVFNEINAKTVNYVTTNRILDGIEYGYSTNDNNTKEFSNTSIIKEPFDKKTLSGEYKLSVSYISFANATASTYTATTINDCKVPSHSVLTSFGDNKIKVIYTAPKVSANFGGIDKIYYCSNLQKTNEKQSFNKDEIVITSTKNTMSSSSFKIIGKWFLYMGGVSGSFDVNSDSLRNKLKLCKLTESGSFTISETNYSEKVVIAFPSSWGTLKTVKDNGSNTIITNNFVDNSTISFSGANNYGSNTYKVYIYTPDNALNNGFNYTITIG